jgi:hypothetical protein
MTIEFGTVYSVDMRHYFIFVSKYDSFYNIMEVVVNSKKDLLVCFDSLMDDLGWIKNFNMHALSSGQKDDLIKKIFTIPLRVGYTVPKMGHIEPIKMSNFNWSMVHRDRK